jgi:hypothetical protein
LVSTEPDGGHHTHQIHQITDARTARSVDQEARIRRYLISMSIRTVCVICAVAIGGPLRWVFIAGAVALPYVAVVMANAVGTPRPAARPEPVPKRALTARPSVDAPNGGAARSAEWRNYGQAERTN